MKKHIRRARMNGMSNLDIMKVREMANKKTKEMEIQATEKAFVHMFAITLSILANDYWPKSSDKKIPELIKKVCSVFASVKEGVVTEEDSLEVLRNISGIDLKNEWFSFMGNTDNDKTKIYKL